MTAINTPAKQYTKRNGYRKTSKTPWGSPVLYFFSLLLVTICITPVLYIIFGGFRDNSQITVNPAGWPKPWVFVNYQSVVSSGTFWRELINSAVVSIGTMIGVVAFGLMISYVIARYPFKYAKLLYGVFAAGLMFPLSVAITPLYIELRNLGLTNSLGGLIVPQIAFGLAQTVVILVPFLKSIPNELEEAAELDGCSRLGFFFRMVIPLSMPGVTTVAILQFLGSWNSYMLPLFMLNNENTYTLPLGVQAFSSAHSVDTAQVLAFTSLSMIPALIFFTIFQKKIVGGLTGAVKG